EPTAWRRPKNLAWRKARSARLEPFVAQHCPYGASGERKPAVPRDSECLLGSARVRAPGRQSRPMEKVGGHRAPAAPRYCALAHSAGNSRLLIFGEALVRSRLAHGDKRVKQLSFLTGGLLWAISIAAAQTPLEKQLQELKQQYAETTRALEQRITALEQQIEKERATAAVPKEGTVSVERLAQEAAEKAVS